MEDRRWPEGDLDRRQVMARFAFVSWHHELCSEVNGWSFSPCQMGAETIAAMGKPSLVHFRDSVDVGSSESFSQTCAGD
jgi:hypothetical protein